MGGRKFNNAAGLWSVEEAATGGDPAEPREPVLLSLCLSKPAKRKYLLILNVPPLLLGQEIVNSSFRLLA
jgi:hypothetical protein